ncbi:peptidase family M28 family [Aspergillus luchuensis]|uniref:Peptidase family M28 family n=1 Tax=Aspergillus kawachii TaxID=1069201 RepID=A0A146F0X6_ASPKA|nr:peptidase family M28 family [Aspergillus luchuensis]
MANPVFSPSASKTTFIVADVAKRARVTGTNVCVWTEGIDKALNASVQQTIEVAPRAASTAHEQRINFRSTVLRAA